MLAVDYDRLQIQQWLGRLGAGVTEDPYGVQGVFSFGQTSPEAKIDTTLLAPGTIKDVTGRIYPLSDLGLIQVNGAEAVKFLHAQLTNDVENLRDSQWRWFGYCNAKGRMQLSAAGYKAGETVSLICSRPLALPVSKRLGMFVMRAKAKVLDASNSYEIYGLQGDIDPLLHQLGVGATTPKTGERLTIVWGSETLELLALESSTTAGEPLNAASGASYPMHYPTRYLLVAPSGSAIWKEALVSGLMPSNSAEWRQSEVATASARIVPATYELFVPQMLNFESLGGVDFKKGCYPGQEVVARSQYLGKLKRRMFVATLENAASPPNAKAFEPAPALDVWASDSIDAKEPCGQVVLASSVPGEAVQVLFEAQTGAVEQGHIGLRDGAGQWYRLAVRPLPYALLEI
jgi:tRNA-modifying protein YgfZ